MVSRQKDMEDYYSRMALERERSELAAAVRAKLLDTHRNLQRLDDELGIRVAQESPWAENPAYTESYLTRERLWSDFKDATCFLKDYLKCYEKSGSEYVLDQWVRGKENWKVFGTYSEDEKVAEHSFVGSDYDITRPPYVRD